MEHSCSYVFFQVIEGGNYDVDMSLVSPGGTLLYNGQKKQYDRTQWTTDESGEYKFCFSNEFSTFTHKMVYFDFQVGDDEILRLDSETASPNTAMTQVGNFADNIILVMISISQYFNMNLIYDCSGVTEYGHKASASLYF